MSINWSSSFMLFKAPRLPCNGLHHPIRLFYSPVCRNLPFPPSQCCVSYCVTQSHRNYSRDPFLQFTQYMRFNAIYQVYFLSIGNAEHLLATAKGNMARNWLVPWFCHTSGPRTMLPPTGTYIYAVVFLFTVLLASGYKIT